MKTKVY